jgi:site-specific DNA recombinase
MSLGEAKAAIYLRVSTKEQAEAGGEVEGYSIPAQREACLRKAESLSATVVEEFVDRGESAKSADRPELQRLLQFVKDNSVRYVIVHKVDRLARSRLDDVQIHLQLRRAGAQLVSCTESIDETPSGMLLHGIMSTIAEFYSRNLATEVIKGSTQKAKNGGTIGKAPTGYLNHRVYENGREVRTVIVDPVRGPLMTLAFELYATGEWSVRRLLGELTERGLTSAPSAKRPGKPLVQSNLLRLLRHPYYKGLVVYMGVEYPGKHEPLVSEELWQRVQDLLDQQGHATEKNRTHHHYLKGTVYCGACRSRLIVHHARSRLGVIYPYYVCAGRHEKRTPCTRRAIDVDYLEQLVEDHYRTVQPLPELHDKLRHVLLEEIGAHRKSAETERHMQQRRIERLERERQKLLDGFYAGAIPTDLMRREQTRISGALDNAKRRMEALQLEFETVERNLSEALRLAANWHGVYLRCAPRERRQMNQAIFERLYVTIDGTLAHTFAEPFASLLSSDASVIEDVTTPRTDWVAALEAAATPVENEDPLNHEGVQGLRMNRLVGRLGLEPSTLGLKVPCSTR